MDTNIRTKMAYLVLIIITLFFMKPSISFKPNGQLREYGVGYDSQGYRKTFYTFQILIIVLTIILTVYN